MSTFIFISPSVYLVKWNWKNVLLQHNTLHVEMYKCLLKMFSIVLSDNKVKNVCVQYFLRLHDTNIYPDPSSHENLMTPSHST